MVLGKSNAGLDQTITRGQTAVALLVLETES